MALLRVSSGTAREALQLRPSATARFTLNFYISTTRVRAGAVKRIANVDTDDYSVA